MLRLIDYELMLSFKTWQSSQNNTSRHLHYIVLEWENAFRIQLCCFKYYSFGPVLCFLYIWFEDFTENLFKNFRCFVSRISWWGTIQVLIISKWFVCYNMECSHIEFIIEFNSISRNIISRGWCLNLEHFIYFSLKDNILVNVGYLIKKMF
jgi:hypothetical protein